MSEDTVITAAEAARLRGDVTPKSIRRWCRNGWLRTARRSGNTWLMNKDEVLSFQPPRPGWRANVPRCHNCGEALVEDHNCNLDQAIRWQGRKRDSD